MCGLLKRRGQTVWTAIWQTRRLADEFRVQILLNAENPQRTPSKS